jgi:hypothetical protein
MYIIHIYIYTFYLYINISREQVLPTSAPSLSKSREAMLLDKLRGCRFEPLRLSLSLSVSVGLSPFLSLSLSLSFARTHAPAYQTSTRGTAHPVQRCSIYIYIYIYILTCLTNFSRYSAAVMAPPYASLSATFFMSADHVPVTSRSHPGHVTVTSRSRPRHVHTFRSRSGHVPVTPPEALQKCV